MRRPPPLQLQFDNMFPGLGVNPRIMQVESFINAVYQSNLRIPVLLLAIFNALRYYLSSVAAWADLDVDLAQNSLRLASVSRTLATIYTITCASELFGALSAMLQRRTLVRAYAYLAFLSATLVTGAGIVTTTAYFAFADEMMRECASLAAAGQLESKSSFRGDHWPVTALSPEDAKTQCLDIWSAESTSQVVSAALFYLLPSVLCFFVAFVYYCQTADPTHPANLTLTAHAIRMEAYAPLPDADARPPTKRRTTISPRSYQRTRAVAVAPVAAASGSSLSPGPPSFGVNAGQDGRSYQYQAFRLSAGPEDDAFI